MLLYASHDRSNAPSPRSSCWVRPQKMSGIYDDKAPGIQGEPGAPGAPPPSEPGAPPPGDTLVVPEYDDTLAAPPMTMEIEGGEIGIKPRLMIAGKPAPVVAGAIGCGVIGIVMLSVLVAGPSAVPGPNPPPVPAPNPPPGVLGGSGGGGGGSGDGTGTPHRNDSPAVANHGTPLGEDIFPFTDASAERMDRLDRALAPHYVYHGCYNDAEPRDLGSVDVDAEGLVTVSKTLPFCCASTAGLL